MKLKALIFDVDGTIANTEREGHLPACNEAFSTLNYPVHWSWEAYKELLPLPGTPARVRQGLIGCDPDWDEEGLRLAVARVTAVKREIYLQKYAAATTLRPGVKELVAAAVAQGVRLAIETLSHESQVIKMLQKQLPAFVTNIEPLLGKEAGNKHAPDSPLFKRCLALLGLPAAAVLVIEDSKNGTTAAVSAGLSVA